jgi:acyl carrier protein
MLERGDIEERIYRFVVEDLRWDGDTTELTYDTSLIDGAMDSLGIVKTISFLETDFGITVNEDEISPENFESIHALTGFVERKGRTES